jgi:hypothetical protein
MSSIISTSNRHFLHVNVLLRHASGHSGEAEQDIETILTFVSGGFSALADFTRYLRSIATFVAPDPNVMLRAARLRDVQWRRPAAARAPDEQPRFLSLFDAIQLASALWVKETAGVADLEFLAFEDFDPEATDASSRLSPLRLQDYADESPVDTDVLAVVRLMRAEPVLRSRAASLSAAVG